AFAPSGRLLAVASGVGGITGGVATVRLWGPNSGKLACELPAGHWGGECSLAFSPSGRTLATIDGDNILRVWEVPEGRLRFQHNPEANLGHRGVVFSPDGKLLASAGPGNRIVLWDANTWKPLRQLTVPLKGNSTDTNTFLVAFSPDSKTLAAANYEFQQVGTLCLLDVATGKERLRFRGHEGQTRGLAFSPD